tara:strand:- start:3370 stop:4020 length:651 start_codon:yes stop_codon:yes gene_type:complete
MNFSLETIVTDPEKEIKNAIILLHGYGGDGKDISMISLNWKRHLPNTVFLSPNGHEICAINPNGYQWFDLSKDDQNYITKEALKAEKRLFDYIEEVKIKYDLNNSEICLSGFSQGCMMALNVGLTSNENFNCIVGFSGKIIDKSDLEKRIKSNTKIFLFHGDQDAVVPPNNLLEAKDFLIRNKIPIETKMIKNCDHHIPIEASSLALNFIKNNLQN